MSWFSSMLGLGGSSPTASEGATPASPISPASPPSQSTSSSPASSSSSSSPSSPSAAGASAATAPAAAHPGGLVPQLSFGAFPPPDEDAADLAQVFLETFALTSQQLFDLVLADDAPFSFTQFHHGRGDKELCYTPWRPFNPTDSPDARLQTPGVLERRIVGKLNVDGAFTRLHKLQRWVPRANGFLMITHAVTPDVMLGTDFSVSDVWEAEDVDPSATPDAAASVSSAAPSSSSSSSSSSAAAAAAPRHCRLSIALGGHLTANAGVAAKAALLIIRYRIKSEGAAMWKEWAAKLRPFIGPFVQEAEAKAAARREAFERAKKARAEKAAAEKAAAEKAAAEKA